jgi:hypothetical protein
VSDGGPATPYGSAEQRRQRVRSSQDYTASCQGTQCNVFLVLAAECDTPKSPPSRPRAPTVPTRGLASLRQRFVDRGGDQFACVGNHIATKVELPMRVCADAWAESGGRRGIHSQQSPAETGVRFTHQAPAIAFDATQRSGSSANEEGRGGRGRATAAPWSDTQASFPFEAAGPGCCECPTGELRRQ